MIVGSDDLKQRILDQRHASFEDSVTYNLTSVVDSSNISHLASALVEVIFDQEISNWIAVNQNKIKSVPGHNVTITLSELSKRKLKVLNKKFWKRIMKLLLHSEPGIFLRNTISKAINQSTFLPAPGVKYSVLRITVKTWAKNELKKLKGNISIH